MVQRPSELPDYFQWCAVKSVSSYAAVIVRRSGRAENEIGAILALPAEKSLR